MIFRYNSLYEVGIDEVGRGACAGRVLAGAAMILPGFDHPKLNDSKQMSEKSREEVFNYIIHSGLCVFGVGHVDAHEIDTNGIVSSTMSAMHLAVADLRSKLSHDIEMLLVDGNYFNPAPDLLETPYQTFIKGDSRFIAIAAASVVAKVTRDRIMGELSKIFPGYGWESNKGYGTKVHIEALRSLGPTTEHRLTFIKSFINDSK